MEASIFKQHQNHRYQGQAGLSTSALAPKFALASSNYRPRHLPYIDDRRPLVGVHRFNVLRSGFCV